MERPAAQFLASGFNKYFSSRKLFAMHVGDFRSFESFNSIARRKCINKHSWELVVKKYVLTVRKQLAILFSACAFSLQPCASVAQVLPLKPESPTTRNPLEKAPASTIEKSRSGIAQELYVEFEYKDIQNKAEGMRRNKGIHSNDDEIENAVRREFKLLREEIFPGGRLGAITILHASDVVPTAKVLVPDFPALQRLLSHPKVKTVYEEQKYVPYLQESLPLVGQPGARAAGKTGAGTAVVVIDDFIIPSLFGCKWPEDTLSPLPVIGTNGCRISVYRSFGPPDVYRTSGRVHGSNVVGIVDGVAPGTKLVFLQIGSFTNLSAITEPTWDTISKAIEWTIQNAKAHNISAVNLSFGTTGPIHTDTCIGSRYSVYFSRLRDLGVIPVSASGNEGSKTHLPEPACTPLGVSVGNIYDLSMNGDVYWDLARCTDTSPPVYRVACSSNSNSTVTLLAPGTSIYAAGYPFRGTSQAAPHVAGAIAVLRAPNAFPNESLDSTIQRMTATGRGVTDPKNNITKPLLNLTAALAYVPVSQSLPIPTIQSIFNMIVSGD